MFGTGIWNLFPVRSLLQSYTKWSTITSHVKFAWGSVFLGFCISSPKRFWTQFDWFASCLTFATSDIFQCSGGANPKQVLPHPKIYPSPTNLDSWISSPNMDSAKCGNPHASLTTVYLNSVLTALYCRCCWSTVINLLCLGSHVCIALLIANVCVHNSEPLT